MEAEVLLGTKAIGSCHVMLGANDRDSAIISKHFARCKAEPFLSNLASLTSRCTPTQENGHDGGLRWWEVVVLLVDGAHGVDVFLCRTAVGCRLCETIW